MAHQIKSPSMSAKFIVPCIVSEAEMIRLNTQVVLTHRYSPEFSSFLDKITGNLKSLDFSNIDVVRHLFLHFHTLSIKTQHEIMGTPYYQDNSTKGKSTTFAINQYTKEKRDEDIVALKEYARTMRVRSDVDAALVFNQVVAYFANLSRAEMLSAIQLVRHNFSGVMSYLTPAQAQEALVPA
jgi:hypothetical protein